MGGWGRGAAISGVPKRKAGHAARDELSFSMGWTTSKGQGGRGGVGGVGGGGAPYRSKAVAVQTVPMMVPLNPKVAIGHPHKAVLVAKCPVEREREEMTEEFNDGKTQVNFSELMKDYIINMYKFPLKKKKRDSFISFSLSFISY